MANGTTADHAPSFGARLRAGSIGRGLALLIALTLLAAACGGGDDSSDGPRIISSEDDVLIELPDDDDVVELDDTAGAAAPEEGETAAEPTDTGDNEPEEAPEDTIPLAEEEGGTLQLLDALADFNACLAREGYEFIGVPGQDADPASPQNQQPYIDALIKCNAETGVQQAFQDSQAADADLTAEEIQERNEQFVIVVDCLRGKGWDIDDPTPNAEGLLQPSQDGFASPDGSINTDDIQDCIAENNLIDGNS